MLIIAKRQYSDAEASGVLTNLRQYFPHSIERNPEHDLQAVISGNLSETVAALALHMFEDGNGLPNARECLREGTALGLEYFCGDWRGGVRQFDRRKSEFDAGYHIMWIDDLRNALLMSVLNEDVQATAKLASWVRDDLEPHPHDREWSAADVLYYKALAAHIRGELAPYLAVLGETKGAKTKRARLLGAALNELAAGDGAEFLKALTKYVQYWRKSERRPNRVDHALCADGNILLGLAQQEGVVSADEIRRAFGDLVLHLDKLTTASTDP